MALSAITKGSVIPNSRKHGAAVLTYFTASSITACSSVKSPIIYLGKNIAAIKNITPAERLITIPKPTVFLIFLRSLVPQNWAIKVAVPLLKPNSTIQCMK